MNEGEKEREAVDGKSYSPTNTSSQLISGSIERNLFFEQNIVYAVLRVVLEVYNNQLKY